MGNKLPERVQTYDQFEIHTIMPATGWQAIFYDEVNQSHFILPVHVLALVSRFTYEVGTRKLCHGREEGQPETDRDIAAMNYAFADGWTILDDSGNFCGLLPPGMGIEDHMVGDGCWHALQKNRGAIYAQNTQKTS